MLSLYNQYTCAALKSDRALLIWQIHLKLDISFYNELAFNTVRKQPQKVLRYNQTMDGHKMEGKC